MVFYKWGYDISINKERIPDKQIQYVATSRRDVTRIKVNVRGSPQ